MFKNTSKLKSNIIITSYPYHVYGTILVKGVQVFLNQLDCTPLLQTNKKHNQNHQDLKQLIMFDFKNK